jgi:hypothetical protein
MSIRTSSRRRRTLIAAVGCAAVTAVVTTALPAHAGTRFPYAATTPSTAPGMCPFPVTVLGTQTGIGVASDDGTAVEAHLTEVDTLSANGRSLESRPYTYNFHVTLDAAGNYTQFIGTGQMVVVPIPGGPTFRAAGRYDFLAGGTEFAFAPDSGGVQNLDAFCAALAP